MRASEDRSGQLVTCTGYTGRSPVLTGELVPVDWHGLPVQVTNGPDRSSEALIPYKILFYIISGGIILPQQKTIQFRGMQNLVKGPLVSST